MKKGKFLRNEKGITLIALVITIIVMLILAGVTINLTLGENGIFTTAQKAAKNYTDAQNKEIADLGDFTNLVNDTINGLNTNNEPEQLVAGLYDANDVLLCTWEESGIDVEQDMTHPNSSNQTSGIYVLKNVYPTATKVVLPSNITKIGKFAFYGTNLTDITIPKSVKKIGSEALNSTPWLTAKREENPLVVVNGMLIDGKTASGDVVIPNSVTSIQAFAFSNCAGLSSITIPNSVTSIGYSAFQDCGLSNITIPDSVTSIQSQVFKGCAGLSSITIPNSVTSIGNSAFYNCASLSSVSIPNSVTSIGSNAFYNCTSLSSVSIPNSVTSIGYGAFKSTPWLTAKQVENPLVIVNGILIDGTTTSGDVVIPDGVTSIGNDAFYKCTGLTSVSIPNSVTSIWKQAFDGCTSLSSVTFEDTTTWYVGSSSGETTTQVDVTNASTNATKLTSTYKEKYWTKQ